MGVKRVAGRSTETYIFVTGEEGKSVRRGWDKKAIGGTSAWSCDRGILPHVLQSGERIHWPYFRWALDLYVESPFHLKEMSVQAYPVIREVVIPNRYRRQRTIPSILKRQRRRQQQTQENQEPQQPQQPLLSKQDFADVLIEASKILAVDHAKPIPAQERADSTLVASRFLRRNKSLGGIRRERLTSSTINKVRTYKSIANIHQRQKTANSISDARVNATLRTMNFEKRVLVWTTI